jgi:DNA-binding protein H-NS
MASYEALMAQAEAIRKKAETQRQKKLHTVIADIQAKMSAWGITAEDLKAKPGRKPGKAAGPTKRTSANKGKKVPIKYRDGDNIWTGRGVAPKWLKAAEAAGKTRDMFLVKDPV